jgi:hypothetical protein
MGVLLLVLLMLLLTSSSTSTALNLSSIEAIWHVLLLLLLRLW